MPLLGAIARQGGSSGRLVTLVHHSVPYRVHDSGILLDDDTAEVLAVETDLGRTTLSFVSVYISPASSCPRNCAPDFDALLKDCGDQMVLGDFNAHHPSWFSRTGDDRAAAREEALDGAVNSLQLTVANQDLPSRHPSQDQPSSPDVTLLSEHLLPDLTWSTLGSDHLPIIISLSCHARPHCGKLGFSRTSARTTGRDTQQKQKGNSPNPLYQPPTLLGKKSSGRLSAMPVDTTSPVVMSGIKAALSPKLCDPSSRREIRASLTTLSNLPSSCTRPAIYSGGHLEGVRHRLSPPLVEMIHRSRLCHILVRWLVAYLRDRKASSFYQQHHSPSHQVRVGVLQGSVISPAVFNQFLSDCPIPDLDMKSYADDFIFLASAPSIVEAEARAN